MNKLNPGQELFKHVFVWTVLTLSFIPLYLMVVVSLKNNTQFLNNPWMPEAPFHWENYARAWKYIGPSISNTIYVGVTTIILGIAAALSGAFFFSRYRIAGSKFLLGVFMLLMMYPGVANMVPVFKLVSSLGLYNSHWSVILIGVAGMQAMAIYVFKNFIDDIPKGLFDAANVDGCSALGQLRHIVIPMSMPVISTMAILDIIGIWNNFVSPMIFLRDSHKQLISVALLHLEGEYTKNWGELMAGYTIASIPLIILFIFCMRLFVKGLGEGAVKG